MLKRILFLYKANILVKLLQGLAAVFVVKTKYTVAVGAD